MPTTMSEATLQAGSFSKAVAVTPDDNNDLAAISDALFVGGAGDVSLILADDTAAVTFTISTTVGVTLPLKVKRVRSTGTTATNIVALRV